MNEQSSPNSSITISSPFRMQMKSPKLSMQRRAGEHLIKNSPLDSLAKIIAPTSSSQFSKFLSGKLSQKEFLNHRNFPTSSTTQKLTTTLQSSLITPNKSQSKQLSQFQEVISERPSMVSKQSNGLTFYNVAKQIKNEQSQVLKKSSYSNHIDKEFKSRNSIGKQILFQPQKLIKHQLKTMSILQEPSIKEYCTPLVSPRHYHYALALKFKDNSDDYLYFNGQIQNSLVSSRVSFKNIGYNMKESSQQIEKPRVQTQRISKLLGQVNDLDEIEKEDLLEYRQQQKIHKQSKILNDRRIVKHNRILSQQLTNHEAIDDDYDGYSVASINRGQRQIQQSIEQTKRENIQKRIIDYAKKVKKQKYEKIKIIYMILQFLFIVQAYSDTIASSKTNELRELEFNSKDGLINLNATGYFYYTMEFPRPYDVVIYFVAPNCKLCGELQEEYIKVARFYKESGALYATKDEQQKKRAVFFAIMTFNDQNKQVFEQLGFTTAPNLFISQPHIVFVPQEERERYLRDMQWRISFTDGTVTSHKFLEFINKRTGRSVQYKAKTEEALMVIGILLGTLTMGAVLFITFRPFLLNPKVWFFGSIIIFSTCLAGVVYNMIHNVPFFQMDKKGNVEWKTSSGRQQLGFEGLFLSLSMTFVGLTIILIHKISKLVKYKKLDPFVERTIYLLLFACIIIMIGFIEENYRQKSHYQPIYWPPRHYIKGPLSKDQGNSF